MLDIHVFHTLVIAALITVLVLDVVVIAVLVSFGRRLHDRARASKPSLDAGTPVHGARMFLACQYIYWISLGLSAWSIRYIPPGSVQTAVMLTPVLTALYCVYATYVLYKACDEYIRLQILRCVAWTTVVVSFCTLAYFFLELDGYPRLSMLWVNLLGWSVFSVQMFVVLQRSR
jgi:hypothetical protein